MARSTFINIASLTVSKVFIALVFALATPFYIRIFGSEAYGLIGFYQLLKLFFFFFDPGLATALNRQLAIQESGLTDPQNTHSTIRTVETITWTISLLFGLSFVALSHLLANYWFVTHKITSAELQTILIWMGVATSTVWPSTIYGNGLQGLHRQSIESYIQVLAAALQHIGALAFIYLFDLGIISYFIWQAAVNCLQTLSLRSKLLSYLPKPLSKPKFSFQFISSHKRFLAGMSLVFITSFTLSHYDRLFLSTFCSLDTYGAYCFAVVLANVLGCYCHGIHTTFFPRFTGLFESHQSQALIREYRFAYELMALGIIPGSVALFLYAPLVVHLLSTGDTAFEQQVISFFRPLLVGSSLFFMVHIPIVMQYANNWPGLFGKFNLFATLTLIPIALFYAQEWAGHATAIAWATLGFAYVFIKIPLMHKKILRGEMLRWYAYGLFIPLATSMSLMVAIYYTVGGWVGFILGDILTLLVIFSCLPTLNGHIYQWLHEKREKTSINRPPAK